MTPNKRSGNVFLPLDLGDPIASVELIMLRNLIGRATF